MKNETEIRTDKGRLIGYKCIDKEARMLVLISPKGNYLGGISAEDLYTKLNEGPYITIEEIKNKYK